MVLWVTFSHTDHWMFNMAPHGKELSEDWRTRIVVLHKDSLVYKKFGNSLELSYSTVARVIQRFSNTGFILNRPCKGRSKKLSPCAVSQVQKLTSTNVWCQHFFRGCRSGRSACQSSDHTPHTHSNKSVWIIPEGSLFWSWLTKKPANSLLNTTWPRARMTGTTSCGLMSLR